MYAGTVTASKSGILFFQTSVVSGYCATSETSFFPVLAEEAPVLQHLTESEVGYTASHHQIPVHVAHALPGIDRRQVRGLLGRGEPLRRREIGGAAHSDLAGAPLLLAQP